MRRTLLVLVLTATACRESAKTRSAAIPIDPPSADGATSPTLVAASDGALASWFEPAKEGHRLVLSRWAHGAWSPPTTIATGSAMLASWADVPAIAEDGRGGLVATWAETSAAGPDGYDAVVARSTDGGSTWQRIGLLNQDGTATEHGFVSLVGSAGGAQAFWLDGRETKHEGGATSLRTAAIGAAIGPDAVVDARVCDCCSTAATSTELGPRVAYRDRSEDEVRDVAVVGPAGSAAPVHADGWKIDGCPVNGPALAARGKRLAVAWYTFAGDEHRVLVAFSDDAGATFGAAIGIDAAHDGRAPIGRVAIVLDDDGGAVVAWLAGTGGSATVLVRRVHADGSLGAELGLGETSARHESGYPRLATSDADLLAMWTVPGTPSRVRAVRVPLAQIR